MRTASPRPPPSKFLLVQPVSPRFSRISPNPPLQIGGVRQLVRARLQTAGAIAADANTRVVLYFGGAELNEQNDAAIVEDSSVNVLSALSLLRSSFLQLHLCVVCFATQSLTLHCLHVFIPAALGGNATISVELQ
jgi:hypothetical protein